jgi:hypothetical protein
MVSAIYTGADFGLAKHLLQKTEVLRILKEHGATAREDFAKLSPELAPSPSWDLLREMGREKLIRQCDDDGVTRYAFTELGERRLRRVIPR